MQKFFPPFNDNHFIHADEVFRTDRVIDRLLLRFFPDWIQPNHITLFRIIATPPTLILLLDRHYEWGVPLFLLVAFTDAMDGALARTRNKITVWGMMFDPVADKLLIVPAIMILAFTQLPILLVLSVAGVEILILLLAILWRKRGLIVKSNRWGKFKMFLQVIGIMSILLATWLSLPLVLFAEVVLTASVVCALVSIVRKGI
ncbi:MAG: CDP-alcohol phosphatidyltransferase family protein [Patescibacteria group bacterium]